MASRLRGQRFRLLESPLGLRLLQPIRHAHVVTHRSGGTQVPVRLNRVAGPTVELAEVQVTAGDERTGAGRRGSTPPPSAALSPRSYKQAPITQKSVDRPPSALYWGRRGPATSHECKGQSDSNPHRRRPSPPARRDRGTGVDAIRYEARGRGIERARGHSAVSNNAAGCHAHGRADAGDRWDRSADRHSE